MEEIKKKQPISVSEVKEIMEKSDPESMDQIQRWTFDYVGKFAKTDSRKAQKMVKQLIEQCELKEEEAVEEEGHPAADEAPDPDRAVLRDPGEGLQQDVVDVVDELARLRVLALAHLLHERRRVRVCDVDDHGLGRAALGERDPRGGHLRAVAHFVGQEADQAGEHECDRHDRHDPEK